MWNDYPSVVNYIETHVPEPHRGNILALRLVPSYHTTCIPEQNKITCHPALISPRMILHEYGHILGVKLYGQGYPHDWTWTFRDITGYEYTGLGNDMLAEGYAEAVSRAFIGDWMPHEAQVRVLQDLGVKMVAGPSSLSIIPLAILALSFVKVKKKRRALSL